MGWAFKAIAGVGAAVLLLQATGCGTILYPERRGQPTGQYDTDVVILDGLGLFVGIIPGVIAFAVDLTTGAIYLPEGGKSRASEIFGGVDIERRPFAGRTAVELERVLTRHVGRSVELQASWLRSRPDLVGPDPAAVEAELRALNAAIARERIAERPAYPPSAAHL